MAEIDIEALKARIPGWGVDLAPERRPGVPREQDWSGRTGAHWKEPEQQEPTVKIYHTIERPGLTPVFGTPCPPHGLSGKIRDLAYRFGEGRTSHWLLLLVADRVNVVEGVIDDLLKGRLPNPLSEMGLGVELKERGGMARYQRRRMVVATGVGAVAVITAQVLKSRREAAKKAA